MKNFDIRVDVGSLPPYEIRHFLGGSGDITCAFTSLSPPVKNTAFSEKFKSIRSEIWIDVQILSSAADEALHENIRELVEWSKQDKVPLSFKMAIYEKYRSSKTNPVQYILKSARSLSQKYNVEINEDDVMKDCRRIAAHTALHGKFENIKFLVIVFRQIFNSAGTYQEKSEKFAQYMEKYLVPSTTMVLIASLFYYLDETLEESSSIRKKLRRDLSVKNDATEDEKRANNIASDIGLFTFSSWPQFNPDPNIFPEISIATADRILSLLLEEMCHFQIEFDGKVNRQVPGYRPGSESDKKLNSLVKPLSQKVSHADQSHKDQRIENSRRIADLILKGKNPLGL